MRDLMPNWSAVMYRITERFDEELLVHCWAGFVPAREEQRWEDDGGSPMRGAA